MMLLIAEFLGVAAVIVLAGIVLTKAADTIGEQTRLGRTLAGMLLLAVATSLPELAVDCSAAARKAIDLAAGDLLGSSLMNLLILAMLDLAWRTGGRMLSRQAAAHALSATMSIVLTGLCLLFILLRVRWNFLGIGVGSLAIAATYVLGLRMVYFDQRIEQAALAEQLVPPIHNGAHSLRASIIKFVAAAAVILVAAPFLAGVADELADRSGLGRTFLGTTLVALSTSLPELVTTFAAVRMGSFDLAVGNIFGSNSFNMVILLPVDAFYGEPLLASVSLTHAITAACVILVTSVAVMGLLYRAERRLWVVEPDAVLVVLLVFASLGLVYAWR